MTIMINVSNALSQKVNLELLEKAIQITLETHNKADADLTLQITNDETIRQLNHTYRGVNKATDVLAFNQDFINPETNQLYLGDIIISIDRAFIQAHENNHTINKECALLTIHGTLHLLGYDHSNDQEKLKMWKIQDKILQDLLLL
jgi:probable rRNA maturation factor